MSTRRVPRQLVMTRKDFAVVLHRVAGRDTPGSQELYTTLTGLWGPRPDRRYITFRPTPQQRAVLRTIPLPANVVQSPYRYVAVYRCDARPELEVTTRTIDRPPRKRKFRVAGGARKFTLVSLHKVKESKRMAARGKTAGKGKTKAADPIDELEAELEGLEEVELEDEVDDEEPEVEDEESDDEDDEETDYSSMKNADLKALCKKRGIKGVDKQNKAGLIALLEKAGDDEEDDEDEEEDDPLADLDRAGLKALLKEHGLANAKKSESDDDLRARLADVVGTDDEDEEEDDEEEEDEIEEDDDPLEGLDRAGLKAYNKENDLGVKVLKSMSDEDLEAAIRAAMGDEVEDEPVKPKGKGKTPPKGKQPGQLIRKLPAGKLGAEDIAKMAGTNGLAIRNFLRKDENKKRFPKNEELNRYAFTEKQAKTIVVAYKKGARGTKAK